MAVAKCPSKALCDSHFRWRPNRILADLHHDLGAFAHGGSTHDHADRLGDAALLANDAAHVVLRNGEVIHDDSVLIGLVHRNLYGVLVFHKAFGDC